MMNNLVRSKLEGQLLVASPYLADPSAARTVVLVFQHGEHGSAGVILNRPLGQASKALWRQLRAPAAAEQPLHFGGPFPGPMLALHQRADFGELAVTPELFLAADRKRLGQLVQQEQTPVRLFVGCAGWSVGQLERELQQGAWMLLPATAERVFCDDTELWAQAVRAVGRNVLSTHVDARRIPSDVRVN